MTAKQPAWRRSGLEPDYRFTLANERTFLAWIRSALALMAGGVVLVQFATRLSPPLVFASGIALTLLAGLTSVLAYRQWRANEIAMRHARPLPHSPATALLATGIALLAAAITAALWLG